jgi:hypothetical protein
MVSPFDSHEGDLQDLYGRELRKRIEQYYPGLGRWIAAEVDALYGALAFGLQWQDRTGLPGAAGQWLQRHGPGRDEGLVGYDQALRDFAQLVDFAADDAWLSELLASRGLKLEELHSCARCGGFVELNCLCGP